jgi:hypothetical protein
VVDKDETSRQQEDSVDWESLESEIEYNAKDKAEQVVAQLPRNIRVSRSRDDTAAFRR